MTALYCKLLIILGLAFPMAEQISHEVSIGTYQLFYVYLYLGSLLFLIFVYFDIIRTKAKSVVSKKDIVMSVKKASTISQLDNPTIPPNRLESQISTHNHTSVHSNNITESEKNTERSLIVENIPIIPRPRVHYGSFYLRVGCVCKYIICIS